MIPGSFVSAVPAITNRRHRPCPICLSNDRLLLYQNRMASLAGIDLSYHVVSCGKCGFVYGDGLAAGAEYEQYYRDLSKYDAILSLDSISNVDWLRARTAVEVCSGLSGPVIDIGCGGAGILLAAFREAGIGPVYGLDPARADAARSLFGLTTIRRGNLADAPAVYDLSSFSLVCLTGVLEHLADVRVEIEGICKALSPGARILIEVPSLERFEKQPSEPYGELSIEHINFFSAAAMQRLFLTLGFSLVETRILSLPVGWADSLFMLFEKESSGGSPSTMEREWTGDHLVDARRMQQYLNISERNLSSAIGRLAGDKGEEPWLIFGAGSHTARLLPRLEEAGLGDRIRMVVDNNQNLQGKTIGRWPILAPSALIDHPNGAVVISSFRSQDGIRQFLTRRYSNRIISLY